MKGLTVDEMCNDKKLVTREGFCNFLLQNR